MCIPFEKRRVSAENARDLNMNLVFPYLVRCPYIFECGAPRFCKPYRNYTTFQLKNCAHLLIQDEYNCCYFRLISFSTEIYRMCDKDLLFSNMIARCIRTLAIHTRMNMESPMHSNIMLFNLSVRARLRSRGGYRGKFCCFLRIMGRCAALERP